MRELGAAITPLRALGLVLGWNLSRHIRKGDLSTVCSESRELIPPALFVVGWIAFNVWFVPHWLRPLRNRT